MKSLFACLLMLVACSAFIGCRLGTRGGPGAVDQNADSPLFFGQSDDTFNLSVPSLTVRQGETQSISIGIERGTNFEEDVALEFASLPSGVTLEPSSSVIKRGDAVAQIAFTAADDASLGDFTVKLTGRPTHGADASNELKIKVVKG